MTARLPSPHRSGMTSWTIGRYATKHVALAPATACDEAGQIVYQGTVDRNGRRHGRGEEWNSEGKLIYSG